MTMIKFKVIKLLLAALCLVPGLVVAAVVVVGHPGLGVNSLSAQQVSDIFLGKTRVLPNGTAVTVIDQKEGSAAKEEFYAKVVGKDQGQLKAYWAKIVFTGKGSPPEAVANDDMVIKRIASTPNSIGYVSSDAVDGSVKVLLKP